MASVIFLILLLPAFFLNVFSLPWTMDLPEVRQYYFQKYGNSKNGIFMENGTKTNENETESFNNYNSDGLYYRYNKGYEPYDMDYDMPDPEAHEGEKVDLEDLNAAKYAEDFEYQSYMEKKVTSIVSSGSKYLEGLRQSLERYYDTLEDCNQRNFTEENSSRDNRESPNTSVTYEVCRNATRKSEKIRRIAQLAMHTTSILQDRMHNNKYDHQEEYDLEDRSLILHLSWFLDKLALLTGFEPDKEHFSTTTKAPIPSQPIRFPSLASVPEDIKEAMLDCLYRKSNSTDPATVRCSFPVSYSDFISSLFDSDLSSQTNSAQLPADILQSFSNTRRSDAMFNTNKDTDAILSNSDDNMAADLPKRVSKRSVPSENPLANILEYYAKYKAWTNANTNLKSQKEILTEFPHEIETKNSLQDEKTQDLTQKSLNTKLTDIFNKKTEFDTEKASLPEIQSDIRKKRSTYEHQRKMPRVAEDSMQDISYYGVT